MRNEWASLVRDHAAIGIKYIRSMSPSAYAWLYRNDRTWLENTNRVVKNVRTGNYSSTDWDGRDNILAQQVRNAVVHINQTQPRQPIHLWQLCAEIPDLRPKLHVLGRLPLTDEAIKLALNSRAKSKNSRPKLI